MSEDRSGEQREQEEDAKVLRTAEEVPPVTFDQRAIAVLARTVRALAVRI